ncbi:MAG TPA: hypothetical protein VJG90_00590 [Candidatus Nanoarchaeia archaeon]|nr:hypothetical protein [Candidatus Nanoarchaeia archaeon]
MIKGLILGAVIVLLLLGGYLAFFNKDDSVIGHTVSLIPKGGTDSSDSSTTPSLSSLTPEQTQTAYHGLIVHILDLREVVGKDILKQVELVNIINQDIKQIGSDNIQEQWETTALCLARTCTDKDFMQLILTVAIEGDRDGYEVGNLIMNILTANKYWGSDNTIRFSESLDKANKQITSLNKPAVSGSWKKLVACDGQCAEKNSLTFDAIRQIVNN